MIPAKPFYMIRHGQTEANQAQIMAGSLDSPLTETGKEQAKAVQNIVELLEIKPKSIMHSNLSRARDTASIINEVLDIDMHEEPDLAELFAGDWEGRPYEECRALFTENITPPNGESFQEFFDRVQRGTQKVLEAHDGPVLIVCHGGVFRALGGIYGLKTPGIFKNCHLYEFQPDNQNEHFPWEVWSYEQEETVNRVKEEIFNNSEKL